MIQPQRGDRQHADALLVDQEGIFVGAVGRAAIFHHPQPPGGELVVDAVVQQDDAVGDVFLQAVAGEGPSPLLAGDDGGDALVLEPAEQPPQLGPQDAVLEKPAKSDSMVSSTTRLAPTESMA